MTLSVSETVTDGGDDVANVTENENDVGVAIVNDFGSYGSDDGVRGFDDVSSVKH